MQEQTMTGLQFKMQLVSDRIRELREITGLSVGEMAVRTGVSREEYLACEAGNAEMSVSFLYRCALSFGVDLTDLIGGYSPKLRSYTLTRNGTGQKIDRAHHMTYYNLAADFKNPISLPLQVELEYSKEAEREDIELSTHEGQECDIVLKGHMKVQVGEHTEILTEGDSIYYDSSTPHGMIAVDGKDCTFYAIVIRPAEAVSSAPAESSSSSRKVRKDEVKDRIYTNFVEPVEDENGLVTSIKYKNTDKFNFAFDVLDELGRRHPDKLALLHVSNDGEEHRFTFEDIKKESGRAANYFRKLGIEKGDRVILTLMRRYQYWIAVMALNKIGAVVIPASNQLQAHDFNYRFKSANIKAVLACNDAIASAMDEGAEGCDNLTVKIAVSFKKEGWHSFDEEYGIYSSHFPRTEDSPCGDDPMVMFFTSGTNGYPKLAAHNCRYPLGHFATAKYWHQVNPDGLHLTISDTGWAKSMWGKLYGQWLCEAAIFVYDFDRFDAEKILPMFARYNITTFCAPPTMYRMLIKSDLDRFDLSSIQHTTIAGEALNPEVFRQFFKSTGHRIMEGFGQSESTLMIGNLAGAKHKIGSMGKPVPPYDIHLLDPDGKEVGTGENGEICINIANGLPCGLAYTYEGSPEISAETWKDGWYHTGDLAWKDEDGFFWYVGRTDDVIKSSGYRIGPFEIENVIMELPYVLECGVSAAPDPVRGQVVKASIVLVKGTEPTEELKKDIQNYVKSHTAPYKYPRIVVFKDSLPKTTSGKIIRKQL